MQYTEVDIKLEEIYPFSDILVARLNEIEFESYVEYEKGLKAYIPTGLLNKESVKEVLSGISELTEVSFTMSQLEQKNWNAEWENNYSPVVINESCVIRAHFHNIFPGIQHDIVITPKMSFGTGHHETTSLMMNRMFALDFNRKSVLDLGSGTGVLSILASKLGAGDLVAVDCNEWAFKNSKENAQLNHITDIQFIHGDINTVKNERFDIILANINRNSILDSLDIYVEIMNDSADILLSGFLEQDNNLILKNAQQLGLELVVLQNKNIWQMLHLKRV